MEYVEKVVVLTADLVRLVSVADSSSSLLPRRLAELRISAESQRTQMSPTRKMRRKKTVSSFSFARSSSDSTGWADECRG